jgi:hypothetical protein
VKPESSDNLVYLSSDSYEGELPNVSLPTLAAEIPIHDDKYNEPPKSICTPTTSFGQLSFSYPSFYPNTQKCLSVMQCLRLLAFVHGSRNKVASIDFDKIAFHKVQCLPPLFNGNVLFELPLDLDNAWMMFDHIKHV